LPPLTSAEKMAALRARAKPGTCVVCVKRKARAGKATCKPCNEAAKERVAASREA